MDEDRSPAPVAELEQGLRETDRLFLEGKRAEAIAEARRIATRFPSLSRTHRALSSVLTYKDLYRYDDSLQNRLVADGSMQLALASARAALRFPGANYEDFLQAGYCLTALGSFAEATAMIRTATDMFCKVIKPGLFATLNDTWEPLLPKFLIIGAAKAGTTSLYDYISWHPRVLPAVMKEINYFGAPERGWEWYSAHFPRRPSWEQRFITGEARVGNFDDWSAPRLVRDALPGVRLIVLLRNPADRAISHYYNERRLGVESRSLEDAFEQELSSFEEGIEGSSGSSDFDAGYLRLGLYAQHLKRWLKVFPANELLILISEEFFAAPDREMRKVFKYLGIGAHKSGDYSTSNIGSYDNQARAATRTRLMSFFSRHNEELFELLGRRIDWS